MGVHGPTHKCSWVLYYYFLPGNFLHDTLSSAFSRCVEIVDIVVGTSEQTVPSLSFLSTPALAQYLNIRHRWWWILRRFVASCWHDGCILQAWWLLHASMSEGDVSWQLAFRGSSHACMLAWGRPQAGMRQSSCQQEAASSSCCWVSGWDAPATFCSEAS